MKKNIFQIIAVALAFTFLQACSPGGGLVANKRDAEFYNQFVNPTSDWPQAESRVAELKVLQINDVYNMRFALFENGKVYYQIDRLGNGNGTWVYENGAMSITATRPIFDMELTFSAAEKVGDKTVVRFVDRYGFNSAPVIFRNPEALKSKGVKPETLKEFKASDKNI
ncbi:hypothetical protein AZI86_07785 [Bdellovibrio bacteriovorus]|uniref:Lipoprotein n=1 Tax=Bdellovibrio bacteriovorus TaxID=959 RepID=A0A150WRA3_BDEBC|nr:hypothetical protein [Bdellovibrio bacteriovorus]KYG66918.1 hypothetical protein AZI86_07785 [Bdellovibrio bacteriovorus]